MSTAASIRSGHCDTCFQHVPNTVILKPSDKLKENLLAAYMEVDQIDSALDDESNPVKLERLAGRLITIQDFNNATGEYIIKTVAKWEQAQTSYVLPQENDSNYTSAFFKRNNLWEEVLQVKELTPFSDNLSKKIARVFQKASLVQFKQLVPEPIDVKSKLPARYQLFMECVPRIVGEKPKVDLIVPSITNTPSSPSANSPIGTDSGPIISELLVPKPANETDSGPTILETVTVQDAADPIVQPSFTARIVVNYEGSENDKLYIRGTGPNMSWGPGIELRKEGGQWIYESTEPFETFEFKLALNDQFWEAGENNHKVESGKPVELSSVAFHDLS
ncbi:MAG: hypothetical protein JSR57_02410 [Verrucomicrobia bacterium]|nr:hypothetical protein [Verrucomicrobiota bacterium]